MSINKQNLFILITFILQLTLACSPQTTQSENWVIFSESQSRELGVADWFAQNGESTGYWSPTEKDVLVIENKLVPYLQENADAFRLIEIPVWERLEEYNRQYLGIILAEKKIIYVNFFCSSFESDYRNEFVFVMDGGSCFFQVKYDVETGELFELQVNGEG